MEIIDLIPIGRENAVKRSVLVQKAISAGIVKGDEKDADRLVRQLIERARIDYVILNNSDGRGYYRCSTSDIIELQKYIRQEEKRARASFKNIKKARALYEDFRAGRITQG